MEGVSRSFSHQLVRHTVGHSYEQQSQHYILEKPGKPLSHVDLNRVPPQEANAIETLYDQTVEFCKDSYDLLIEGGLPREEARQVFPNGTETRLIWTANLNAILWFTQVRACRVNCQEIIEVAAQVRSIIKEEIPLLEPFLGPTCYTQGVCFEGIKRFKDQCRLPWKPAILWTRDFPARTIYVNPRGWWETGGYGCALIHGSARSPKNYEEL